jgi:hypothetical protein
VKWRHLAWPLLVLLVILAAGMAWAATDPDQSIPQDILRYVGSTLFGGGSAYAATWVVWRWRFEEQDRRIAASEARVVALESLVDRHIQRPYQWAHPSAADVRRVLGDEE